MEPIRIVEPASGATTAPLQRHVWTKEYLTRAARGTNIDDLMEVGEDKTQAKPVTLRWRGGPDDPSKVKVVVDGRTVTPQRPGVIELPHLHVGKEYEAVVSTSEGSAAVRFITNPSLPRWITVPGTTNVRDCGGWRLSDGGRYRQGLLYRGAEMNTHLSISPAGARVFSEQMGIKTIVDLRGAYPDSERPESPFSTEDIRWVNIPLLPYEMISKPRQMQYYRSVFQILAEADHFPLYFHCWGGADRTGTVAYLLGAFLGMEPEDLLTDYELTTYSIWGVRSRMSSYFVPFLDEMAKFGDTPSQQAGNYFQEIGLTHAEMQNLRENLVENGA